MRLSAWVLGCVALGCGLERDYEAFLEAAKGPTESSDSSGSTAAASSSSAASTGTSSSGVDAGGEESSEGGASEAAGETGAGSTSGVDGTSGGGSSSGGLTPFCGDGVVNLEFEECDDGNFTDEDLCTIQCQRPRLIFVTSVRLQGEMGGLQGADAYCKSLALKAMQEVAGSPISDPGNFKALLSTSTQTIGDRHFFGKGPYRRTDGLTVSDSFVELFSEPHHNPIDRDERGELQIASVYTGTDLDGSPFPGIDFCADWTSTEGSNVYGDSDDIDGEWIYSANKYNPEDDCISERPIYCVEQE